MSDVIVLSDSFVGADGAQIETRPPEIGSWNLRGDPAYISVNTMRVSSANNTKYNVNMDVAADMSIELKFLYVPV